MIGSDVKLQELRVALAKAQQALAEAHHGFDFASDKLAEEQANHESLLARAVIERQRLRDKKSHVGSLLATNSRQADEARAKIGELWKERDGYGKQSQEAWRQRRHSEVRRLSVLRDACTDDIRAYKDDLARLREDRERLRRRMSGLTRAEQRIPHEIEASQKACASLEVQVSLAEMYYSDARVNEARAARSFMKRSAQLHRQQDAFVRSWPDIARAARVPEEFVRSVLVSVDNRGETHVYYGGEGPPDGPNHAHHVLTKEGALSYRRGIGEPHGPHNYLIHNSEPRLPLGAEAP